MALDILEPLRPTIELRLLQSLTSRVWHHRDFVESPQGIVSLSPHVAGEFADWSEFAAKHVAEHAEYVQRVIAESSPEKVAVRATLTNRRRKQKHTTQTTENPPAVPNRLCEVCGTPLKTTSAKVCAPCWTQRRRELATQLGRQRTGTKHHPTATPETNHAKALSISENRRATKQWENANPNAEPADPERYARELLPLLTEIPTTLIARALGVSQSAASRMKNGRLTPHARHWPTLTTLTTNPHDQNP